jgi:hypothetical protein
VNSFKEKFCEMISGFEENNIFNVDESGLLFRAMPSKTLAIKGDKFKSGRNSKERLTILLAASVTGEKPPPFVIRKVNQPRCFKNVNVNSLPVIWRANKAAWMTYEMFTEWLNIISEMMKQQNRKILMTVDNCPAHPKVENLSIMTVKFLLLNATLVLQMLHQGIIKNFKALYRKLLLTSVVENSDNFVHN